jgi:hypothetical protein
MDSIDVHSIFNDSILLPYITNIASEETHYQSDSEHWHSAENLISILEILSLLLKYVNCLYFVYTSDFISSVQNKLS